MPTDRKEELLRLIDRGARVRGIREELGLTGEAFAAELSVRLSAFGVTRSYDRTTVSRLEGGRRELTAEEAAVVAEMDPERRGIAWLVFGGAAQAKPERFRRRG